MERSTLWSGLMLLILSLSQLRLTTTAKKSCRLYHPQSFYHQAKFVAELTIRQYNTTSNNESAYYDVEVGDIFKANKKIKELLNSKPVKLWTESTDYTFTGAATLELNEKYVIGGEIKNGQLHTTRCALSILNSNVTDFQREGFKQNYKAANSEKCRPRFYVEEEASTKSPLKKGMNKEKKCRWPGFSPMGRCHTRFGICKKINGICSWELDPSFEKCVLEYKNRSDLPRELYP